MARTSFDEASAECAALRTIRAMIAAETAAMAALADATPKVLDGHSDGKRVRYVRHETRVALLADVLALLTGGAE